ncbi:hypothetical protein [Cellulomonas sp. NPDC089187]|uniref:hypothetical protein n=1 Tax=Cellulomonas sp. NPDC089187 TaxID=3154970 RepID=UPI0034235B18
MSSTPTPPPGQDDRPAGDEPVTDNPTEETGTESAEPSATEQSDTTQSGTAGRRTTSAPITPPSVDTPGRGAHLRSRQSPVPPEPDEDDVPPIPRLAGPADTAPTTTLPALDDPYRSGTADPYPTSATDPLHDPLATPTPDALPDTSGPIRRTSFRTGQDVPAATAAPFAATPPPAPPYGTDLPGTGPADDQVPPGDTTAPTPEPALAPTPPQPVQEFHAPERSRGGVGRLLLGMLIGLLAGAVGIWLVVFGQSRILGVQAPGWDASYDPLGVVLVTVGVLILAALIGVGTWSSAAPSTAGLLATVIGVVYLYVPATTHADTVSWIATDYTRGSVERTVVAASSGTVFVIGALLLSAGIAFAALNRRRTRRG